MIHRGLLLLIASAQLAAPGWSQPPALTQSVEAGHLDAAAAERHILVTLPQRPARRLQYAGSTPRGYLGGGAYKTSQRVKRVAARLARSYGLRRVDEWPIEALKVHCVVYELPHDRPVEEILALLESDPRVESAQPMRLFKVLAQSHSRAQTYDDPYLGLQHGIESMQIESAHLWAKGVGVRVAVIDTGVDLTHPELEGRIAGAENFVDQDSQLFTADVHGTAVAGIIASAANNGIGIVGVAPAVEILALKACWPLEAGSVPALCSSFTLAKAISFAIARRPDVLNLSLTGPPDPLLSRLLARAIERGIIVVSAADPETSGQPGFPAALDRVIAVATAGRGDRAAAPAVARLSAPGDEIFTTMPYGAYDFLSGSSLAAAHVSGLVALLLEHDEDLSAEQILALLQETGGASAQGVNGCRALTRLLGSGTCPEVALASLAVD